MKKTYHIFLLFGLAFLLTACPGTTKTLPLSLTLSPENVSLKPGESITFTATVSNSNDKTVDWTVNGGSLSGSGLTVTYTAPEFPAFASYELTVSSTKEPNIFKTANITITKSQAKIEIASSSLIFTKVGASRQISARVLDDSGTPVPNARLSWSSSNPAELSVSETGLVTSKTDVGSAVITAKYQDLPPAHIVASAVELGPNTFFVQDDLVLNLTVIESQAFETLTFPQRITVELRRTPETEALSKNTILVSGPESGLIHKIASTSLNAASVVLTASLVNMTDAFKAMNINVDVPGEPYLVSVEDAAISLTSQSTGVTTQASLTENCKFIAGNPIKIEIKGTKFTFPLRSNFMVNYEIENFSVKSLSVIVKLTAGIEGQLGELTLANQFSGGFVCEIELTPIPAIAVAAGPFIFGLSGTPTFGFEASATLTAGGVTVIGPKASAEVTTRSGFSVDNINGFKVINDDPITTSKLTAFDLTTKTGDLTLDGKVFLALKGGLSVYLGAPLGTLKFITLKAFAGANLNIKPPFLPEKESYTSPLWKVGLGISGDLNELQNNIESFNAFLTRWGLAGGGNVKGVLNLILFELFIPFANSPSISLDIPTGTNLVKNSPSTFKVIAMETTSSPVEPGAAISLYRFSEGKKTLLAKGVIRDQGKADLSWTPTDEDIGKHSIRVEMTNDVISEFFPYASNNIEVNVGDARPDLVIKNQVISPLQGAVGTKVKIQFDVFNQGSAEAGASSTQILISPPVESLPANATLLKTLSTPSLNIGTSERITEEVILQGLGAGMHTLWLVADANNAISQLNTDNDISQLSFTVTQGDPTSLWTKAFGTKGIDNTSSVATDAAGNIYVYGQVALNMEDPDDLTFDYGPGLYLRKFAPDGSVLWTEQLKGPAASNGGFLRASSDGYNLMVVTDAIYITGNITGVINDAAINVGSGDAFILKYSLDGSLIWGKQFGTSQQDFGRALALDSSGNIYVTGSTHGDFETNTDINDWNVYLAKFSASGNQLWAKNFPCGLETDSDPATTCSDDYAQGITVDKENNVIVVGHTTNSLYGQVSGSGDSLILKINPSGTVIWGKQFGEVGGDWGRDVAIDSQNNIYIVGDTQGGLDSDDPNYQQGWDGYVMKLSPTGEKLWLDQIYADYFNPSDEYLRSIAIDDKDNLYIAGQTNGSFNPDTPSNGIITDGFIGKYNSAGELEWLTPFGPADGFDAPSSIAVSQDYVYVASASNGSFPGLAASLNDYAAVLYKFDQEGN